MILYDLEQQFDVYIIWTFFDFFDIISNNKDIHYDCVSASTEFGYPNSGMLLRHCLSKHRPCVHTWLSEHRRLCPHDIAFASNTFGYPNTATCPALVMAVSPAGSVSVSAFGRGVRRTPAPLKPFERRILWI